MNIAIAIVIIIVILFGVAFFHELGHFIVAKRAGVIVEEFGIGFPPRLLSFKRGETRYSLNLIPLGAFVKTAGEDDPTVSGSLASKSPWIRMGVYAAGPLANVLLAFLLLSAFFMVPFEVMVGNGIMVSSVIEGSPADIAGIKPKDVILKVDEHEIHNSVDLSNAIDASKEGEEIVLRLQGKDKPVSLLPEVNELGRRVIGVYLWWNIVSKVEEGSPAAKADIRPWDTILSIDGQSVYSPKTMSEAISSKERVSLFVLRGEETFETSLLGLDANGDIGVDIDWVDGVHLERHRYPLWKAISLGGGYLIDMPGLIKDSIPIIKQDPGKALVGPVGAGQLTAEILESFGSSRVVFLAGLISVCIGLFNLVPIPPLDGGGIVVALVEGIRRGKRLSPRAMQLAYTIGTVFMLALIVVITYNDILRLIRGESLIP